MSIEGCDSSSEYTFIRFEFRIERLIDRIHTLFGGNVGINTHGDEKGRKVSRVVESTMDNSDEGKGTRQHTIPNHFDIVSQPLFYPHLTLRFIFYMSRRVVNKVYT